MASDKKQPANIRATISGNVTGQVAVGSDITQTQTAIAAGGVTIEDLAAVKQLFGDLSARIEAGAPPDRRGAALERVKELEEAVTAAVPDLTTIEYVKQWFVKQLPAIAGSVTGLVVHPLIGKLVGAAGDTLAAEFRRRFGHAEPPSR